jgi:transcriptional regulator with XRE-family HTH domain
MTSARTPRSREEWLATFGRRLRVLRLWNGLSEAEMARMLGISVRSLKGREAGKLGTRGLTRLIIALAETFEVSTDWLLGCEISDAYRDETRPLAPGGRPMPPVPLDRFLS